MFRKMRRWKQQLTQERAEEILRRNTAGTLALLGDEGYPYAVPLCYVYHEGKLYFHSASSGHKIDAVRGYDKASFCVIDQDEVVPEKYTTYFRSAIAFGKIRIIQDKEPMRSIAARLAMKYSPQFQQGIPGEIDAFIDRMAVMELEIEHLTAKEAIELVNRAPKGATGGQASSEY